MAKRTPSVSSDRLCCNCSSGVGESSKLAPVLVSQADAPDARSELWCPYCFCLKRMHLEPERFNATCTGPVKCGFCGWTTVCFSMQPFRANICGHCSHMGAMLVMLSPADEKELTSKIYEFAEDQGLARP